MCVCDFGLSSFLWPRWHLVNLYFNNLAHSVRLVFHACGAVSLHLSITHSIQTACSRASRRIENGIRPSDVSLYDSLLEMYAECRVSGTSTYDLVTCNGPSVDQERETTAKLEA